MEDDLRERIKGNDFDPVELLKMKKQIARQIRYRQIFETQLTNYSDWVGISVDATQTYQNGWQVGRQIQNPPSRNEV